MKRLLVVLGGLAAGVLAGLLHRRPVRSAVAEVELRSPSTGA